MNNKTKLWDYSKGVRNCFEGNQFSWVRPRSKKWCTSAWRLLLHFQNSHYLWCEFCASSRWTLRFIHYWEEFSSVAEVNLPLLHFWTLSWWRKHLLFFYTLLPFPHVNSNSMHTLQEFICLCWFWRFSERDFIDFLWNFTLKIDAWDSEKTSGLSQSLKTLKYCNENVTEFWHCLHNLSWNFITLYSEKKKSAWQMMRYLLKRYDKEAEKADKEACFLCEIPMFLKSNCSDIVWTSYFICIVSLVQRYSKPGWLVLFCVTINDWKNNLETATPETKILLTELHAFPSLTATKNLV